MRRRISLLAVLLVALIFVACGGSNPPQQAAAPAQPDPVPVVQEAPRPDLHPAAPQPPPVAKPVRPPKSPPADGTVPMNGVARFRDLSVVIAKVETAKAPLTVLGRATTTSEPYLLVHLHLTNSSGTAKLEYKPWAGNFLRARCFLEDEFDNKYKLIAPGLGDRIIGQVADTVSIYPGKELDDLLVFELPVDAAKKLTLTLPGDVVTGGAGVVRFRIDILSKADKDELARKQKDAADQADRERRAQAKAKAEADAKIRAEEAAARAKADAERVAAAEQKKREAAAARQREKDEEYAEAQVAYAKKLLKRDEGTDRDTAKERLHMVVKDYPDTKAAPEARDLLDKLK